jgi:hypothetical protein
MSAAKKVCQNCASELNGEYCSACGQRDVELKVPLNGLMNELGEELLSFDSRLFHSLRPFLLKPGTLTIEYVSGKRTRYISPFKLYFFMSFLYFFFAAITETPTQKTVQTSPVNVDSLLTAVHADSSVSLKVNKGMNLTFSENDSGAVERKFGHRFAAGLNKVKSNPQLVFDKLREHTPQIIFLLLPIFALLLKIIYIRSNIYYIQHIVFTFYFHSYAFFVLLLIALLNSTGWSIIASYAELLVFAIPFSLYRGMVRVYGQSRGKTFIKFTLLGCAYGVVLIAAVAATVFVLISLL